MKRLALFGLIACGSAVLKAQVGHQVRAVSFEYLPDTVYMMAGDTILFRPIGGHDMTEVDSLDWALLQPFWNGGFATPVGIDTDFVVTAPGTHYFLCAPHSFTGMRGVLIVDDGSTTTPGTEFQQELLLVPNPARDLATVFSDRAVERIELIDASGHLIRRWMVNGRSGPIALPVHDLAPGMYRVRALFPDRTIRLANLVLE